MLKFNNNHIFTGYLKQLLADFNLPKYRIYTKENANYYATFKEEDKSIISTELSGPHQRVIPYIKDDKIQYYINGKWTYAQHTYSYNRKIRNYTKNLQIKNNIYDSYTHEYLGDYLRFQRDYNDLNLMPLYNCFSNQLVGNLDLQFNQTYSALIWQKLKEAEEMLDDDIYKVVLPLSDDSIFNLSTLDGLKLTIQSISYIESSEMFGTQTLPTVLPINLTDSYNFGGLNGGGELVIADDEENGTGTALYLYYNKIKYKIINSNNKSCGVIISFTFGNQTHEKKDALKSMLQPFAYKAVQNYITKTSIFSTTDKNYKIYMVPVKLFKDYTIAIDSNKPVELCCGIYNRYIDDREKLKAISALTYKQYSMTYFDRPILYTALNNLYSLLNSSSESEITTIDQSLKLFIKVPVENKSSIVILEGNYINFNNRLCYEDNHKNLAIKANKTVFNLEKLNDLEKTNIVPITNLQLLKINTGESYPFADRLIEYLSDNAITSIDTNADNIKRVNTGLKRNGIDTSFPSVWDNTAKYAFYEYIANIKKTSDINHDVLGYVDKDVEKYYRTYQDNQKETPCTLSNIDIYPDIYKDSKVKVKEAK